MSYRGQPSWPPRVRVNCEELRSSEEPTTLRGEVGVLTGVLRNQLLPDKLFLYIDHEEKEYVGCLIIEDQTFCNQMHVFIHSRIGKWLKEIGDSDLSHLD